MTVINVGTSPNDGTGDTLREAGAAINEAFENVAATLGVYPLDEGAVGDGETDDTEALQQAIDLAASEGRRLISDRRTYAITASIDLPSNFYGDFGGATIKIADDVATEVTAVRILGSSNIVVKNLIIDGNPDGRTFSGEFESTPDEYYSGNGIGVRTNSDLEYASNIYLENIEIWNVPTYSFSIRGAENVRITNCLADGYGDDGFDIGGKNRSNGDLQPANNVLISGCIARNGDGTLSTSSNGFEVDDGAHHVTITGCLAEDNFEGGYEVHSHSDSAAPHNVTIVGCVSRGGNSGINIASQDDKNPYNIVISGNTISGVTTRGLYVLRGTEVVMSDNVLESEAIVIDSGSNDIDIRGNICSAITVAGTPSAPTFGIKITDNIVRGSSARGIYALGITNRTGIVGLKIANNLVDTTVSEGIYATLCTNVTITGNNVKGHGTLAIRGVNCDDVVITSNVVTGVVTSSFNTQNIFVNGCTGVVISANSCYGGRESIEVRSSPSSIVSSNLVRSFNINGIYLVSSGSTVVTGNRVDTGTHGVQGATDGNDVIVVGNILSGLSGSAVFQGGTCDYWLISNNNYRGETNNLAGSNNTVSGNVA